MEVFPTKTNHDQSFCCKNVDRPDSHTRHLQKHLNNFSSSSSISKPTTDENMLSYFKEHGGEETREILNLLFIYAHRPVAAKRSVKNYAAGGNFLCALFANASITYLDCRIKLYEVAERPLW
jgi:hypothetical protein